MSELKWFSAKQVFLHKPNNEKIKPWYEERIILLRAVDHDNAAGNALKNGREYCDGDDEICNFLGLIDTFELFDSEIEDGAEVYSNKTISSLNEGEFISHYYPDITKDCEQIGEKHYWHNTDGNSSACYNCKIIREGRLWELKDE